jgi:hypothetical protein
VRNITPRYSTYSPHEPPELTAIKTADSSFTVSHYLVRTHPMTASVTTRLSDIRLISAFLESIFYGIYITTCFECFAILLHAAGKPHDRNHDLHRNRNGRNRTRIRTRVRWGMLSIAFILVAFSSLHLALELHQVMKGFLGDVNGSWGGAGPSAVFENITSWDSMVTVWYTRTCPDSR